MSTILRERPVATKTITRTLSSGGNKIRPCLCTRPVTLTCHNVTCKEGKVLHRTRHESPEGEQRYNSILSLTSALDGNGWSTTRPGRFTPGKDPVPLVQKAGWAPGPVRTGAENLAPPVFDPRTVQPVASRYTDGAIPTHVTRTSHALFLK